MSTLRNGLNTNTTINAGTQTVITVAQIGKKSKSVSVVLGRTLVQEAIDKIGATVKGNYSVSAQLPIGVVNLSTSSVIPEGTTTLLISQMLKGNSFKNIGEVIASLADDNAISIEEAAMQMDNFIEMAKAYIVPAEVALNQAFEDAGDTTNEVKTAKAELIVLQTQRKQEVAQGNYDANSTMKKAVQSGNPSLFANAIQNDALNRLNKTATQMAIIEKKAEIKDDYAGSR